MLTLILNKHGSPVTWQLPERAPRSAWLGGIKRKSRQRPFMPITVRMKMSQLMFLTAGDQTDVRGWNWYRGGRIGQEVGNCVRPERVFSFFSIRIILIKSFMGVCTKNHVSVSVYHLFTSCVWKRSLIKTLFPHLLCFLGVCSSAVSARNNVRFKVCSCSVKQPWVQFISCSGVHGHICLTLRLHNNYAIWLK